MYSRAFIMRPFIVHLYSVRPGASPVPFTCTHAVPTAPQSFWDERMNAPMESRVHHTTQQIALVSPRHMGNSLTCGIYYTHNLARHRRSAFAWTAAIWRTSHSGPALSSELYVRNPVTHAQLQG